MDANREPGPSPRAERFLRAILPAGIVLLASWAVMVVAALGIGGDTVVAEFFVNPDGSFDADSRRTVILISQPYQNHNGGDLAFGSDGPGAYAGTPLGALLPFALPPQTTRDETPFRPQLTAAGATHAATRIAPDKPTDRQPLQAFDTHTHPPRVPRDPPPSPHEATPPSHHEHPASSPPAQHSPTPLPPSPQHSHPNITRHPTRPSPTIITHTS